MSYSAGRHMGKVQTSLSLEVRLYLPVSAFCPVLMHKVQGRRVLCLNIFWLKEHLNT